MVKKTAFVLVVVILLSIAIAGCSEDLSPLPSDNNVSVTPAPNVYNTFEDGVGNFSFNAMLFVENEIKNLENSQYIANMSKEQTAYYDELLLLGKMLKLDLSVINEINLLETDADYSDRADGKLLFSGYNGYRILQNSVIKFGYSDDENNVQSMSGELWFEKNYMIVETVNNLSTDVSAKSVVEFVMLDNDGIAVRYAKTVDDGKQKISKILYILKDSKSSEIAYYEGDGDTSKMISLDKFTNYSVNSMSFGIGTVISFSIEK